MPDLIVVAIALVVAGLSFIAWLVMRRDRSSSATPYIPPPPPRAVPPAPPRKREVAPAPAVVHEVRRDSGMDPLLAGVVGYALGASVANAHNDDHRRAEGGALGGGTSGGMSHDEPSTSTSTSYETPSVDVGGGGFDSSGGSDSGGGSFGC